MTCFHQHPCQVNANKPGSSQHQNLFGLKVGTSLETKRKTKIPKYSKMVVWISLSTWTDCRQSPNLQALLMQLERRYSHSFLGGAKDVTLAGPKHSSRTYILWEMFQKKVIAFGVEIKSITVWINNAQFYVYSSSVAALALCPMLGPRPRPLGVAREIQSF
eukprot:jgi/Picsp_1/2030/NSC_05494-R2_inositol oxygenase 1